MTVPTYDELVEETRMLKAKVAELECEKDQGRGSEQIYRALFDHAGFSIALLDGETRKRVIYNKAEYESLGYSKDEFENLPISELIVTEGKSEDELRRHVSNKGSRIFESWHRAKSGDLHCQLISSVRVVIGEKLYYLNIGSDITRLKKIEKELVGAQADLEEQVVKRTAELNRKTMELTESNTAFKVLLQRRDEAIRDMEESALVNIKQRVLPYIDKLKKTQLSEFQLTSLIELDLNLKDLFSPFLRSLSRQYQSLTPSEVKVAQLIRDGKSSKELTVALGVSFKTIETHRDNLRKKLGLKHKKINLQSYLRTLETP